MGCSWQNFKNTACLFSCWSICWASFLVGNLWVCHDLIWLWFRCLRIDASLAILPKIHEHCFSDVKETNEFCCKLQYKAIILRMIVMNSFIKLTKLLKQILWEVIIKIINQCILIYCKALQNLFLLCFIVNLNSKFCDVIIFFQLNVHLYGGLKKFNNYMEINSYIFKISKIM